MRKRYDYRNDYKNWSIEEIINHLPILKEKLCINIGICDDLANDYLKRISYLENKL